MSEVWITGIGFASSIGHNWEQVDDALRNGKTGFELANWPANLKSPVKLWAPAKGFNTSSDDQEDWTGPEGFKLTPDLLRSIPPSGYYAFWTVEQALKQAGLSKDQLADGRTGLYSSSAGSMRMVHRHLNRMFDRGVMGTSPMGVLSSVVGTLNFNLAAHYKITGNTCGFASACASSGHALGFAFDSIKAGSQDRMVVIGAEDDTVETILPFASMRVLNQAPTAEAFRGPFDAQRGGFVGTGGAVAMILENAEVAQKRGATPLAILKGWGQATDGYHPAKPHPEGAGILSAMKYALSNAGVTPEQVDYLNAHATGTSVGDVAELKAFKELFGQSSGLVVSSTKGLTGHGLSLASILELAITVWALRNDVCPGNAGLKELDLQAKGVTIAKDAIAKPVKIAMSNSSGFGGANVSLVVAKA